jgi:8-oxo-dGTP diphosphatase
VDGRLMTGLDALVDDAAEAAITRRDVVRAAGGVVYREGTHGGMEIVLVHRPAYDDWSLPKGKLKSDERLESGALREVEEETAMQCLIARCIGTVSYVDRRGRDKTVWYWLMRVLHVGEFVPGPEIDEVRWHTIPEALEALSYDHDRDLLRQAALVAQPP